MATNKTKTKTKGKKGKGKGKDPWREYESDMSKSSDMYNKNFPGPLGRLNAGRTQESANYLDLLSSFADPNNASYAGNRSLEMRDTVGRMKSGLDGYTGQEYQGMREQQARDTDQNFMTSRAQLARGQNNYRTGNTQKSAQLLELSKAFGQKRADLEQDLFVKSADEKQRRLETFGKFLGDTETTEFNRGRDARTDYGTNMVGMQNKETDNAKFNLGQEKADNATRIGTIMANIGIVESKRNARRQAKLARENMASNERAAGRSGGGGGGGFDLAGYMSAINGAYGLGGGDGTVPAGSV
jgi:hypothetical protein